LLIKAGAALSPCSYKERETALLFTCKHSCGQQHTEVAHALLSAGAAVEPRSGSEALTPLITATHYGNASIVRPSPPPAPARVLGAFPRGVGSEGRQCQS
jgi:hypothetical protein